MVCDENDKKKLEEVIEHTKEVIERLECSKCKEDHIDLLKWLEELYYIKYK